MYLRNKKPKYRQTTNATQVPARRTQRDAAGGPRHATTAPLACPHLALADYGGLGASPRALAAPPAPRSPSYLYPRAPLVRPPRERDTSLRCPALRRLHSRSRSYVLARAREVGAMRRATLASFAPPAPPTPPSSSSRLAQRSTLRNE
ncbi:hypothetical protein DFH09DRAFT_1324188 [Mycena vulgaris]|nr:hypothetical protein DFH09DRAFT_1324188 [Mycena vulgaris]